ncbi:putative receptor-like protein kinase At3g47110 [Coffea arabica]|uniref:Receptor-like protein kinase At3g47110 n=1 Tax=Coffea arabica TaxID=13443 RepID=A0A6P6UJG8_COFAR
MEFHVSSLSLSFCLTFHAILFMVINFSFPGNVLAAIVRNETDELALLAFKSEITEDLDGVLDSWNATLHFCQWTGVECGLKHQRVSSLDLRGRRLAGSVSPHVGSLSFLRVLDLSDNSFHGVIPSEVGHLFRLQTLNLSYNLLKGEIPANLSHCQSLTYLILDHNFLERHIPPQLGSLTKLVMLYLKNNNLTGTIPASIGNLTSLQELYISYNDLEGGFPDTMAQLRSLVSLGMSWNSLSGEFPPVLFNLSSLQLIGLSFNKFRGSLRPDIGLFFPKLQRLYLANNSFTGLIPASLSNCSELLQLDFPENYFTGNVPLSFGNLRNLFWLNVLTNQLGSGASGDLNFISSLSNCQNLEFLDIAQNHFGGKLPDSITNLSTSLTRLLVGQNMIHGTIPKDISELFNLNVLSIKETLISGSIPESIGKLSNLKTLHFESNRLTGVVPSSLGNITGLLYIYLQDNNLEGSIPASLGNCRFLQRLELSKNNLTGSIPKEIMRLSSLSLVLDMSQNFFSGPLPEEVGNLTNLAVLDLSNNKLSGRIPSTLANCLSLESLYMQSNDLEGEIPSLTSLKNIQYLDISSNNLSGHIPQSMAELSTLRYLNLSFNHLEGKIPVEGVFADASSVQVRGNAKLCGGIEGLHLQPCPRQSPRGSKKKTAIKVIRIVVVSSCLALLLLLLLLCWMRKVKKKPTSASLSDQIYKKVSYNDLLNATEGFSSHNLIGSGNFGTVYKGCLGPDAKIVAIKVIKLQKKGAFKSFLSECQAMRNIRHRNLVKILTACSSVDFNGNDFKALVYEYMPNGSLEKWLHQDGEQMQQKGLSIFQRMNIAIDVASALHYLHNQCQTSLVHCDLKPSNVLLDNDLTAHVSDFGLARLLISNSREDADLNQFSSLGIKGTIGYAAPEYGMGGRVSTQGDVYSFGILLLEIFTGRRPTDALFTGYLNLHSLVKKGLPDSVMEIVDQSALLDEDPGDLVEAVGYETHGSRVELSDILVSVFKIGVACSEEAPQDRMNMSQVVNDLVSVREKFSGKSARRREMQKSDGRVNILVDSLASTELIH